ncbi:peptidase, partial [Methylobacterium sp. WL122]
MREGRTEAESPVRAATRDPQKLGEGASDAG